MSTNSVKMALEEKLINFSPNLNIEQISKKCCTNNSEIQYYNVLEINNYIKIVKKYIQTVNDNDIKFNLYIKKIKDINIELTDSKSNLEKIINQSEKYWNGKIIELNNKYNNKYKNNIKIINFIIIFIIFIGYIISYLGIYNFINLIYFILYYITYPLHYFK